MKAFVINLKEDGLRRDLMRGQLDRLGIEHEFVEAVRGSERIGDPRCYDDAAARRLEGRSLRPGEVGCALSHAAVYALIAERGIPWALVLEDDAALSPDLPEVLRALEGGRLEQGDIVPLSRCDCYLPWSKRDLWGKYKLARPVLVREGSTAQAAGYVVTRGAALAIKDLNVPVKFPADSWGYYEKSVNFRGVLPSLSLVTQRVDLGSRTTADGEREAFRAYSLADLLWHGFKTYNPVGRKLKGWAKALLGR